MLALAISFLLHTLLAGEAARLNNLGLAAQARGDYAEAVQCYERALDQSPDKESSARIHANLAALYKRQTHWVEAAHHYKSAAQLRKQLTGEHSASYGVLLNNYAEVVRLEGKLSRAVSLFRKALQILEEDGAAAEFDLSVVLNNLGVALGDLGRFREASTYLERAVAIKTKLLGAAHPQVRVSQENHRRMLRNLRKDPRRETVDVLELGFR